jgi:DNA-binding SARP family transcriptional activator
LESQHVLVVAAQEAKEFLEKARNKPVQHALADKLLTQILLFEKNIPSVRRRLRPHVVSVPFSPPKLTIQTFGRGQVELDGKAVAVAEWQNQKRGREFFFFLLAHPDGLTKEEIGVVFWPESSSGQLKLQFKNTIYRLRYALGQDVIAFNDDQYWFNQHLDYEYDVELFLDKVAEACHSKDVEGKLALLQDAISLYKGTYLPEFDSAWVEIERERLWQAFSDAALELAQISLERGNFNATLECCNKILAGDRCVEEAHRLSMRAYAAKGNRAAVKRQFESCKQALWEDIQSLPSPQTASLYEALRG